MTTTCAALPNGVFEFCQVRNHATEDAHGLEYKGPLGRYIVQSQWLPDSPVLTPDLCERLQLAMTSALSVRTETGKWPNPYLYETVE